MTLSFLITTHNEDVELRRLLSQLIEYVSDGDEIIVLDDFSDNPITLEILDEYGEHITLVNHKLNKNFGDHKQLGNEQCNGNYIFQIDADEYCSDGLLLGLRPMLEANSDTELFMIPRVNIIRGLTTENYNRYGWGISKLDEFTEVASFGYDCINYTFLKQFGFVVDERIIDDNTKDVEYHLPIINWSGGDYQFRLYKNDPKIRWERPLHELIVGAKSQTMLPKHVDWSLIHDKTMTKQISQNTFYMSEFSKELNTRG